MSLVADPHVHIYPNFNPETFWAAAFTHLFALGAADAHLLCLTERIDCHAFRNLADGDTAGGIEVTATDRAEVLRISREGRSLYLVAGRQLACERKLEILALGTDADLPDGLPASEAAARTREAGGVDVLGWSPGKWLFKRKAVVRDLVDSGAVSALGDSALRPVGWGAPALMRCGLPVFAGTDPLPLAGEEDRVARFGTRIEAEFDPVNPGASILAALHAPGATRRLGRRLGLPGVVSRLRRL